MPLLLVDLDNTLIDRAGAFARWALEFTSARGGGHEDTAWLVAADRDGFEERERLAAMIGERFGLDGRTQAGLLAELRAGLVRQITPDSAVTVALRGAAASPTRSGSCLPSAADRRPPGVTVATGRGGAARLRSG